MLRFILPFFALFCALSPLLLLLTHKVPVEQLSTFLGRFHPVVLHLPIGILLFTAFIECLQMISFGKLSFPTRIPVFLSAFTATVAMSLGILLMQGEAMQGELIISHLRWGIATAVAVQIVLLLRLWPNCTENKILRTAYRFSLFVTSAILVWASHRGAAITHGENYLTDHMPWKSPEPIDAERSARLIAMQGPMEERSVYEHLIVPILEDKCYECHQSRSFKGNLLMDQYESMLTGGSSGPSLIPFKATESLLVSRIQLPISHEEHMPPSNKPQMSEAEIELLQWWINAGAPTKQTFAAFDLPEPVSRSVEEVTQILMQRDRENKAPVEIQSEVLSSTAIEEARKPLATNVAQLKESFPGIVNYVNHQSPHLSVRCYARPWTDSDMQALYTVAGQVSELIIPEAKLSSNAAEVINQMTQLTHLDLRASTLEDDFWLTLEAPQLERLNLYQSGLNKQTEAKLSSFTSLKRLTLGGNKLSASTLKKLKEALPDCIITGDLSFNEFNTL
ncbi:MAG: c-type cytochrome domain-containing protein [Coraliomargaritaceae bacterium]